MHQVKYESQTRSDKQELHSAFWLTYGCPATDLLADVLELLLAVLETLSAQAGVDYVTRALEAVLGAVSTADALGKTVLERCVCVGVIAGRVAAAWCKAKALDVLPQKQRLRPVSRFESFPLLIKFIAVTGSCGWRL